MKRQQKQVKITEISILNYDSYKNVSRQACSLISGERGLDI